MTGIYDRARATTVRLIKKYGQACVWTKPAPRDGGAKAWRDTRAGEPPQYPVSIAWFPPGKVNPMFAFIAQTEVPQASEVGIMAASPDFEPEMVDTINRGTFSSSILHFDTLRPDGAAIMHVIYVKNPGPGNNF